MKRIVPLMLAVGMAFCVVVAQTPTNPQKPQQEIAPEDIIRISTALVQTDVVVTDKKDQVIPDLKLDDFELYENGKKQDVKFMEFVSVDTGRRTEGERPVGLPPGSEVPRDLTSTELKRVVAFLVDDLTIPFQDMPAVREMLLDFVNNQMREGDLVAIVRTVGGKGLLQQFTSDRQLLRRTIATLNVSTHPYSAFDNPAPDRFSSRPSPVGVAESEVSFEDQGAADLNDPNDETQRLFRGQMSLTTADFIIESLKEIPGRKALVLISGGIPIFEVGSTGTIYSNVSYLLNQLVDHAVRAGVTINTMDPRGLRASPGVASFAMTPARSALGGEDPTFGRGGGSDQMFGPPLAGASEHLGLDTVAKATGGVSVVNTNDFKAGLNRILARSSYYLLAYRPFDKFDNKFRKIEIKVKRDGARVYAHRGYVARDERPSNTAPTKEEAITAAAKSPLAKRELDISTNILLRPLAATNKTAVGIHMLIDAHKLTFTQSPEGTYQASFDVVGFVYDQIGKLRGGFSETIKGNLSPADYQRALKTGLTYSANTELPPGYFQIRAVIRDSSGSLGTVSRYLELPDLTKGRLFMSSVFLFAADPGEGKTTPTPLLALRQISHKQDLRYATLIYNAKTDGNKTQVRARMIISQGNHILYQEPEQLIESTTASPVTKIGQLALGKVPPGQYVLTLVITDPLADKKSQSIARSIDFTVVE